ncbi:MAG: aldose 1-epimerase family protein [Lachnospiraceae bacterium]|nr:aldose 1-epimerase family protein [Lachnospiraceae bacterium]
MSKTYKEKLEYVGDFDQLMSLRESILAGGFQKGVQVIEVANGGNLSATVLPGRCMDLYQVRYKGKNMNYIAPCGIVAPEYYDAQGMRWLRNFFVGMLTTCGLQNLGNPVKKDGEELGLHGRIASTPAENVKYERGVKGENPTITLEGTMREARIFGENLTLHRKFEFEYENDSILMTDTITNHGFGNRQFVYALHLNYGYPLLEEGTKLIFDSLETVPREAHAAKYVETWMQVEAPQYPYPERCYFHKIQKDKNGMAQYTVFNEKRSIGVNIQYDGNDLPFFCQWKMLGKGEYVMGMEPMNAFLDGPKVDQEGCSAPILKPGESKTYKVKMNFIEKL